MPAWRRLFVAAVGALSLVGAGTVSVAADGEGNGLITFNSMTGVSGAAVGAVNDRGITGGGFPWVITSGTGSVDLAGNVSVTVKGLVIPSPPLPVAKNPVPFFKAIVSCLTEDDGVVNLSTGTFPASMAGDSTITGHVNLPSECNDPIVFVTSPGGAWFAMSNENEGGD